MAGSKYVDTFDKLVEAFATVTNNGTIQLTGDVTCSGQIEVMRTCVVEMNDHTLTLDVDDALTFKSKAKVTFRDGIIHCPVNSGMVVTGQDSVVTFGDNLKFNCCSTAITAQNKGRIIVNECAKISSSGNGPAVVVKHKGSGCEVGGKGIIKSDSNIAVLVENGGTLLVHQRGLVKTNSDENDTPNIYAAVYATGKATDGTPSVVIVTGHGRIEGSYTTALHLIHGAQATLEAGVIYSGSTRHPAVVVDDENTVFRMVGGKIESEFQDAILVYQFNNDNINKVDVVGGEIFARQGNIVRVLGDGTPDIAISGITFLGELDPKYVAEGFEIVDNKIVPKGSVPPKPDPPEPPKPEIKSYKKGINIYIGPSTSTRSNKYIGSLLVTDMKYVDGNGKTLVRVYYKLPGSGKQVTGFVLEAQL